MSATVAGLVSLSCLTSLDLGQCVGVCWSVLECVGVCWSVLECVGVCCSVLECVQVCVAVYAVRCIV